MPPNLPLRAETALLRAAIGLPPRVVRLLAGRPVSLDGQTLDPETQLMLRLDRLAGGPAVEELPIPAGREHLLRQSRTIGGDLPIGSVRGLEVPGAAGPLPARLFVPSGAAATGPLLIHFHGGGMIYGDLDSHDAPCRFLAEEAGVRVLSVGYRLAPEHPFPAAPDDCWAAFRHVAEHAEAYGGDPARLAVGGDSAGGNLAAVTALRAAAEGVPLAFQLLIYPVTNFADPSGSRRLFGRGFYLTTEFIDLADRSYLAGHDQRDPRVSVAFAEIPAGLAPALVATAGFDPLRDEGAAYAARLEGAGVEVEHRRYPGLIHGFANVVGAGRSQRAAMAELAAGLRAGLV